MVNNIECTVDDECRIEELALLRVILYLAGVTSSYCCMSWVSLPHGAMD